MLRFIVESLLRVVKGVCTILAIRSHFRCLMSLVGVGGVLLWIRFPSGFLSTPFISTRQKPVPHKQSVFRLFFPQNISKVFL
uniref:Uncharacterized protein n=1 Tax=Anguilla anguilla TaxID=7936 RepID=A0A0E9WNF5_ANGAN